MRNRQLAAAEAIGTKKTATNFLCSQEKVQRICQEKREIEKRLLEEAVLKLSPK